MRKKILVTGGAGYIGSHTVVKLYQAGYLPIIIDNLSNSSKKNLIGINEILQVEIPFYKIDCTDYSEMQQVFDNYSKIEGCIHFAAYKSVEESVANPQKYYRNNIGSTEVLLKCLEKNQLKNLIFSSSCTVYGMPDILPVDENAPFKKAESPYGESKQKCEDLIKNHSCNSISLRYFNPIGTHDSILIGDCSKDNPSNLVPIVAEVATGKRKKIIINGNNYNTKDGTCIRDYIHVQDLASAHVKALNFLLYHPGKYAYNVGTGIGLSVLDIIHVFEKENKIKIKYEFGPRRNGDIEKIYSDGTQIKKDLSWVPQKTISEAVVSACKWQKKNF